VASHEVSSLFRVIGVLLLASMLNACTDDEEAKCKATG